MSISPTELVFWMIAATSVVGALTVVFTRDVTRMALGLGVFLLSVAGWFVYFSQSFLAAAQVFVYVGGVLVLVLFAIMLVHRSSEGRPALESRHTIDSVMVAGAVFTLVATALKDAAPKLSATPPAANPDVISVALLGPMLPHFEALGVLLLVALAAVIVISGGERS